jgi:hypothetical protein
MTDDIAIVQRRFFSRVSQPAISSSVGLSCKMAAPLI